AALHGRVQPQALPRAHVLGAQRGRAAARLRTAMRTETGALKVVLAESGETLGGTERVVWELATRLPRSRFEPEVWLPPAAGVDELAASLEARGVPVRRVAEVDSRWDLRGMMRTWRALRAAAPRLLH